MEYRTLGEELDELARTNPEVREAARKLDDVVGDIIYHSQLAQYREHKRGECTPSKCEYKHTKEERNGAQ